jgi:hypothetical protein
MWLVIRWVIECKFCAESRAVLLFMKWCSFRQFRNGLPGRLCSSVYLLSWTWKWCVGCETLWEAHEHSLFFYLDTDLNYLWTWKFEPNITRPWRTFLSRPSPQMHPRNIVCFLCRRDRNSDMENSCVRLSLKEAIHSPMERVRVVG